jgi:transposase-like protein
MHCNSGPRRRHSDDLKAKVLAACTEPGASISGVALAHGLNANLVRKWRSGRGTKRAGMAITPTAGIHAPPAPLDAAPEFVAVQMPAPAKPAARAQVEPMAAAPSGEALIQIDLRRGPLHLSVRWPIAAAEDCRAWLGELSSGLLK